MLLTFKLYSGCRLPVGTLSAKMASITGEYLKRNDQA
jgi:hypothetical protein